MRFKTIVVWLLACSSLASAQHKPFEVSLGWKGGGKSNPIGVNSFSSLTKDFNCVIANNSSTLKVFWFDKEMKYLKESSKEGLNEDEILGGFVRDGKAFVFSQRGSEPAIWNYVFGPADSSATEHSIPVNLDGMKVVGQINTGDSFLYIAAHKKEPVITVYEFSKEGQVQRHDFDLGKATGSEFEKRDLWKALSKSGQWSRDLDVALVKPEMELTAESASSPNKIYYREGKLLLLMDKEAGITQVFEMKLSNDELVNRKISRPILSQDDLSNSSFNSFLFGDRLFYALATSERLTVYINSFSDGSEIKRFEANENNSIDFKNTPVMQEGGNYSKNAVRELEKTRQLLRKMLGGRVVISAVQNVFHQDEVTVGAFREVKNNTFSAPNMGALGGAIAGGVTVGVGFNPFYSSWGRTTRFKMLLDPKTSEHLPGEMAPSAMEDIRIYSKDLKIPDGGATVFTASNASWYAYYDREIRKLTVMRF